MNIYYLGRPLGTVDSATVARILRRTRLPEADAPIRQRRVPNLLPLAPPSARINLRQYVPLLSQHLERIGIAPLPRERVAMVMLAGSALNGVLAFALRQTSGLTPYLVVPARRPRESARVIDPGSLLDVLGPPGRAYPPRRAF